jgi:hypothetical protein
MGRHGRVTASVKSLSENSMFEPAVRDQSLGDIEI